MGWPASSSILLVVLGLLVLSAGIEDARHREIANWKNAVIALLAPLWWWASGVSLWPGAAIQLGGALVAFALFATAFRFGWMGGGDVKLIGALALWLPIVPLIWMLIVMSIVGGVVTLVMVGDRAVRRLAGDSPVEVPYGVAIAVATLLTLPRTDF